MTKRKILYSPEYGAGWTTWNWGSTEFKQYLLTYQPFIDALEQGETLPDVPYGTEASSFPIYKELFDNVKNKFPENKSDYVCVLGCPDLKVAEVYGEVKINEYDGFESVEERSDNEGWL